MSKPGLLLVYSDLKPDATKTKKEYHDWYKQHLKDIIGIDAKGAPESALRYEVKSANDQAKHHMPFVALYPLSDVDFQYTPGFQNRELEGAEDINFDGRVYEEIQQFIPGTGERANGRRGPCVIAVGMTPGGGEEGEKDFDEWYHKQHLDMLAMCKGYLRTTRYRLLKKHTKELLDPPDSLVESAPKYVALHEYEEGGPQPEQLKEVVSTEWSKKIIAQAEKFEREILQVFDEETKDPAKDARLQLENLKI